jgi:hypothetical protein
MPASKRTTSRPAARRTTVTSRVQGKITKPAVTPRMVEHRARELALIAGREKQVTETDRVEAKRELLGPIHPTPRVSDDLAPQGSPWGSPPASAGRRAKRHQPTDDQISKELVEEGVDEAEHDQMVTARKVGK